MMIIMRIWIVTTLLCVACVVNAAGSLWGDVDEQIPVEEFNQPTTPAKSIVEQPPEPQKISTCQTLRKNQKLDSAKLKGFIKKMESKLSPQSLDLVSSEEKTQELYQEYRNGYLTKNCGK